MGMKLKSGADLCGFELSRFCVQNDVAIPDAPASGRKYFHTGTGTEGKYSLLGRERIYTGTSWRAAAYVDDLANLDLATNADYLALKEKVDLLSGEVDTDAIISNMKEVTAFLSGFAEDANLMTVLDGKLNKSGGTITSSSADALTINRTGGNNPYLTFNSDGTILGRIGFDATSKDLLASIKGVIQTLLHSGNVGDYAIKKDAYFSIDTALNVAGYGGTNGGWTKNGAAMVLGYDKDYRWAIQADGTATGHEIVSRYCSGGAWTAWKTIAFTDSDITGYAAGLKHSNGVIAAQIDPYGNIGFGTSPRNKIHIVTESNTKPTIFIEDSSAISGCLKPLEALYPNAWSGANLDLYIGAAESAKNGGYLRFYYDAAGSDKNRLSFGLYSMDNVVNILGSGYVGIGLSNPQAKLDVYGNLRAWGALFSRDVQIYRPASTVEYINIEVRDAAVNYKGFDTIDGFVCHNFYSNDKLLLQLNGSTNIAGFTGKLNVAKDIVANGTIACKGVAAEGSAPVGTVDKWAGSIATGTKSQTYTHGLGTTDITVAIYEKNGNEWVQILTDVDIVNANTIRVTFGANTTVEHRIVVMG
jgi:hypothetical protein